MNIDAKISITTACGAKCATCPSWHQPAQTMSLEDFETIYTKLSKSALIGRILINGTGDVTAVPGWGEYFKVIAKHKTKEITMTTNAAGLDHIPEGLDEIIISFNGGTPESYHKTTGLDFYTVAGNIQRLYPNIAKLKKAELHCLIWKGTEGDEEAFMDFWRDFPGAIRFSYKTENQGREYFGIEEYKDDRRVICDYLAKVIVKHDGHVSACDHDWGSVSNFGNLLTMSVDEVWMSPEREQMAKEHMTGQFGGICENCNYNVPVVGKVAYV